MPREQPRIILQRPIVLTEYDVNLTPNAQRRAVVRKVIRAATFLVAPLFIAQTLAFGSFIYEEALQATAFAARGAILAEDQAIAIDAMQSFERMIKRAQAYQDWFGDFAFWSQGAFGTYFREAAPAQLTAYYAEGKARGLWGEHPERWKTVQTEDGETGAADTWRGCAIAALATQGFRPETNPNPETCTRCRARARATGFLPKKCVHALEIRTPE